MKKTLLYLLLSAALLGPAVLSGAQVKDEVGEDEAHNVKYRVLMRDLDRDYQDGLYTRTEYVQRQREIKSLYGDE